MSQVQSTTQNLFQTLGTNEPYSIPYNQRPYKWSQGNWDTMWSSLFSKDDYSNFFGTIILLTEDIINNDPTYRGIQIFDGQQRITTFTILIKAAIEALFDKSFVSEAGHLAAYLLYLHGNKPRLNVTDKLKEYFIKNIQTEPGTSPVNGNNDFEKTIFKAYSFFYSESKKYIENECNGDGGKFFETLTSRLKHIDVVILKINDVILGIEIFESVNATGEKLDASELVKNILIKYGHMSASNMKKIHDEWTDINDMVVLSGFKLVDFLHYYWISKYKYTGKNKLFQSMKSEFSGNSQKWMDFFDEFKMSVSTLLTISVDLTHVTFKNRFKLSTSNPATSSKIINYLNGLKLISNKSWIIPIFTLLNYELKINNLNESFISKNFHKLLKKHFVFSFVHFNILSKPTRDFTPAMYRLALKINKAINDHPQNPKLSKEKVSKAFVDHWLNPDAYVAKQTKDWKLSIDDFIQGVNKIKYDPKTNFLLKIIFNDIITEKFNGNYADFNNNSFEHYLPQDPTNWGVSLEIAKNHIHKIGNLLWLNTSVNSKLQNKPHTEKLDILVNESSILDNFSKDFIDVHKSSNPNFNFEMITENQLKNSDFQNSPSEIDKRTKIIAGYMYDIYVNDMGY